MEQVMGDEFECVVDDGSLEEAAGAIVRLRERCLRGDFAEVARLQTVWEEQRRRGGSAAIGTFKKVEVDQETDGEDEDDDDEEDEDEVMGEAPESVKAPKQRVEPEVDEDGFTKVVVRRKR